MHSLENTETQPSRFTHPLARGLLFWGAAALVVALDQATKAIIRSSLDRGESWPDADWPVRIRYVTNTGAAFGILQDQTFFLIIMATIGLGAIYLYYRYPPFEHGVVPIAIGMMLGGAAGNLIDRIRLGRVTDFIDFRFWPAFNVADSSISIGIMVLLAGYILLWPRPDDRPPDADG
jgi:signal peptidase II